MKRIIVFLAVVLVWAPAYLGADSLSLEHDKALEEGKQLLDAWEADKAIEHFRILVAANPEYADAHFHLALAYNLKVRLKGRAALFRKPDNRYKELALEEFKVALDLDPKLWFASYMIAADHMNHDNFERAIEYYRRSIQAKSDYSIAYGGMARAYYQLGEYGKAVELYKKAISLDENIAQFHHGLGLTYLKLGDRLMAAEQLEILRALDAQFYEALKRAINNE